MLELKNLTKIYRTKGADVKALDNVSLTFGKTGLVFLLGKSGSGKSTLLNVAGGLDSPSSGEVIVMGKSSKDFSGSDFDSYRNTYVGFVFQEYNVLNEFNVEENVALALELQGKKKNRAEIDAILKEVELGALAKRRPNTLSGGQKQRIAIARALVKDPQIIMADEPTGALDSATGKQVFETLKRLSEKRLVIVVSHDREFAEFYGDRIIELKDGKVISDVTKVREKGEEIAPNITRHGDTLSVRGGTADEATMSAIVSFLRENDGEILISRDGNDIAAFKRTARMGDDGSREQFAVSPPPVKYEGKKAKFIRSRLPAGKAIAIGASSLRLKPFRLILTILLSTFAFIMFGLFSTMMFYDGRSVLARSFLASEYSYLTAGKQYAVRMSVSGDNGYEYTFRETARFTEEEISSFGQHSFGTYDIGGFTASNIAIDPSDYSYYIPIVRRVAALPEGHPLRTDMVGSYPVSPDQIAVSEYFLECAENSTFTLADGTGTKKIASADDLIGETVLMQGIPFEVTGVFKGSGVFEKYRSLKENDANWLVSIMYQQFLSEGLPTLALVSDSFRETYSYLFHFLESGPSFDPSYDISSTFELHYGPNEGDLFWEDRVKVYDGDPAYAVDFFGEEQTVLEDDELILPASYLRMYYETAMPEEFAAVQSDFVVWEQNVILEDVGDGFQMERPASPEEIAEARQNVLDFIKEHPISGWTVAVEKDSPHPVRIVGAFADHGSGGVFCSQAFYDLVEAAPYTSYYDTKYEPEEGAVYDTAFVLMPRSEGALKSLLSSFGKTDERDVSYVLSNVLYESVELVNLVVAALKVVFLVTGILLAVFASLLLFNFISVSIANKKKEIGILRAVGARGADVFKIFFSESGIIVGICTVVSVVGTALLVALLNFILRVQAGLDVAIFVFGPLSILVMVGVAALIAFISTFLPVYFAARKKPVESIRAL